MQETANPAISRSLVAAVTQSKINCARRPAASAAQPQAGPRLQPQRLVRPQLPRSAEVSSCHVRRSSISNARKFAAERARRR